MTRETALCAGLRCAHVQEEPLDRCRLDVKTAQHLEIWCVFAAPIRSINHGILRDRWAAQIRTSGVYAQVNPLQDILAVEISLPAVALWTKLLPGSS